MHLPLVVTGYLLLLVFGKRGVLGAWLHDLSFDMAFTWKGAALVAAVLALPMLVRVRCAGDSTSLIDDWRARAPSARWRRVPRSRRC